MYSRGQQRLKGIFLAMQSSRASSIATPSPDSTNMRTSIFMLSLAFCLSANACPPGTAPQRGVGWQGCAPTPGTNQSSHPSVERRQVWADRWGAIAVDTAPRNSVGYGAVTGMERKSQAERAALKSCREKGGTRCEIEISYYNQCAVLVWGDNSFNTSGAASEEEAKRRGMDKCTQAGESNCEIFYSGCSIPVRVQ